MTIKKINNVERASKFFYYPSSFVCKLETDLGFTKLCIHKFSYDAMALTTSPSYQLHPNVFELLSTQEPAYDIKNINSAFKSLTPGQTLLINLNLPVDDYIPETMQNSLSYEFELNQTTPVVINSENVVIYNSDVNYGKNNNRNNLNSSLQMNESNTSGNQSEYYDTAHGDRFPAANEEGEFIEGVFRSGSRWHPSMATPPVAGAAAGLAAAATERENNSTPTQLLNTTEENGTPTQLVSETLTRTPPETPMLYGGRTNKKHRKVSKQVKRTTKNTKKTSKTKTSKSRNNNTK